MKEIVLPDTEKELRKKTKAQRLEILKKAVYDVMEVLDIEPREVHSLSRCPLCGRLTESGEKKVMKAPDKRV